MRILSIVVISILLFGFGFEHHKKTVVKYVRIDKISNQSLILWSTSRKLKWEDFLAAPDKNSKYKAITTTKIKTKVIAYSDSLLTYDISCYFESDKSWTKLRTNDLLMHEQLHFDIAEVATRKMRKNFLEYRSLNRDSINLMMDKLMSDVILERRSLNESYDEETEHGTIACKQKEWKQKIEDELKALDAYSSTRVTIKKSK